jgi:GAF domain-containing protein
MSSGLPPGERFDALAQRLRDGQSVDEVQQIIVDSAVALVEGCDRAAIGVLTGDRFRGVAATDDVARLIDVLQNEADEGPCLEASADKVVQLDNDITQASEWPRLAAALVDRTPVRAVLAVPLVDEDRRSGALNIFADHPNAFTKDSVTTAAILAGFASVSLAAADSSARATELEAGLLTSREIGAAVGILMATHRISQEEAFDMLSQASQRLNRKLRDIASGIVRGENGTAAQ